MPQRTNVQFFVRSPEGQIGEFSLGNMQLSPQGGVAPYTRTQVAALIPGTVNGQYIATVKWAQRFYKYYSDNFEMGGDGQCSNGKMLLSDQIDVVHGFQGTSLSGYNFGWNLDASTQQYPNGFCNFLGLSPNCGRFRLDGVAGTNFVADCCTTPGPSTSSTAVAPIGSPLWRGRWWRVESVTTNRTGPGYRLQVFLRDITSNTPEQQVIDTNGTYGHGGEAPAWTPSAQLTPNEVTTLATFLSGGKAYGYRGGTPCLGWIGYSYYMQAQWDTDTGQRIGAASEVEGGAVLPQPPVAPTNLRISMWDLISRWVTRWVG